ncbi:MAG TPA: hypothetical protein VFA94_07590, partial [Acidimicrobiales bacterium]|nr:hypothetical protein [Acidimicrobiales bacterium]
MFRARHLRVLFPLVAALLVVPLLSFVSAAAPSAVTLGVPTPGNPATYNWTGGVLQSPDSASSVATPTTPKSCDASGGLCEDTLVTVPAGVTPSTLYVRISWTHPVWKAYLYVTAPDGTLYPETASASTATQCDEELFNKGCGNETSLPVDEVSIPDPAPGTWKIRVAAVNIHDEAYAGMVSLTNSSRLQYAKEQLKELTSHLTRSQRINVVFAGWKPTDAELKQLQDNLPDEYVPTTAQKQSPDYDDVRDGQGSGLVQHQPAHYTGTDPTNSNLLPKQVFAQWVPYFEPLKFNFDYHFLAADDTYTKDLFAAAAAATTQDHDPGPTAIYATSAQLPKNYKTAYLTDYNNKFGAFRGPDHVVTDTSKWDLVDAFTVEDWIQNSRMDTKYSSSFTDLVTKKTTSGAFINPDPYAVRDPQWDGNGTRAVDVDRNPQGTEQGVTFMLMDTFSPAYAKDYFRPDHYHYWGSFNHITDPDTGSSDQIDDARGWGGRYRFYFQDLGSAPSFYERENWLRDEVVGQN